MQWVPVHKGVVGNKASDERAKEAAHRGGSPPSDLPNFLRSTLLLSSTAAKATYKKQLAAQHTAAFKTSPHYATLVHIDPTVPSTRYKKLTRQLSQQQTNILTQLRTGHVPLNHHLHRIGAWETPFCVHCGTKRETVFHYIMSCPECREQCQKLRSELAPEVFTFANLLTSKVEVPLLLHYIAQRGRLSMTFTQQPDGTNMRGNESTA